MSTKIVDATKINTSPIEKGTPSTVSVSRDPLTRDPLIDQKIGIIGNVFGYGEDARLNIVGLIIFIFIILLIGCVIGSVWVTDLESRKFLWNLVTPIFGIITGAIGYVIGKNGS
jgi:hypothetical protein